MKTPFRAARRAKFTYACELQAEACAALGSPFTAQLCQLMATHQFSSAMLEDKLATWPGDLTYRVHAVPLRLCGALNALARSGQMPALTALYPPHHTNQLDQAFWQVLDRAASDFEDQILAQLAFAPQTNEVRRASALMPALLRLAARFNMPIKLYELGASAGLNLALDHFAYQLGAQHYGPAAAPFTLKPDWQGPTPPAAQLDIVHRVGCDLNPLDSHSPADVARLISYIWPDQTERVDRTEQAIEVAKELDIRLDAADAAAWLEHQIDQLQPGHMHVVYNTVAFQYFPPPVQQRISALLAAKGASATKDMPLVWLQLEKDGHQPGFTITQQLWPAGETHILGRADAHGRWITWHQPPKVLKLQTVDV
ncbi:DUF2332 domain-containing protein [Maritalea mediterranea]|uniref:DUF2332 family protein n=1 Tax=Maritalea mediterranea TaxID=2909667 RepID=A0ABS9E2M4_9HYPH|nr:DUF2332 family protein [Maritalea mediterranea]MCF4097106.1 DUF2332 family protein [Maritalea mediterranea]